MPRIETFSQKTKNGGIPDRANQQPLVILLCEAPASKMFFLIEMPLSNPKIKKKYNTQYKTYRLKPQKALKTIHPVCIIDEKANIPNNLDISNIKDILPNKIAKDTIAKKKEEKNNFIKSRTGAILCTVVINKNPLLFK